MTPEPVLSAAERAFLEAARRAILATIGPSGRPRLVPVCFALGRRLYTPLDEKPKRVADVHRLARVADIVARPSVTLVVDRWDEDWDRLAWLRLEGEAEILEPAAAPSEHADALAALRARYPQYAGHALERLPVIAIGLRRVTSWGRLE